MPYPIDETHDPKLESWVESANDPATDFPIQNLPIAQYETIGDEDEVVGGYCTIIGDQVVDLVELEGAGLLRVDPDAEPGDGMYLWTSDAFGRDDLLSWSEIRKQLSHLFRKDTPDLRDNEQVRKAAMRPISEVRFELPTDLIGDYTDFYASLYHATNVGSMFRPDNPLLPNYKHIPIAYHGRASTIVPSGTPVRRPKGQLLPGATIADGNPTFGPCKLLDYELEVGFVVGRGNAMGESIDIHDAEDHILGMCLVNDWSARDIQKWEYQPLGPFLAKNFATTVSPCIVTMEALAPFRCPAMERSGDDPKPLSYLTSEDNLTSGGVDITLEVYLSSSEMRSKGMDPVRLSKGSFKDMYWTIAQMLTHHTASGCQMNPGDLLASGTVSGPTRDARGCMLELTWDGDPFANPPQLVPGTARTPIKLPTGEERRFLADGDEVIIKGYCEREGFRRIGFGECRGVIQPAAE
ncbi:MAG: fumarylacetoacetase [Phycisphaerales bacterium JB059]